jgi:phosphopantetheinyl transferase
VVQSSIKWNPFRIYWAILKLFFPRSQTVESYKKEEWSVSVGISGLYQHSILTTKSLFSVSHSTKWELIVLKILQLNITIYTYTDIGIPIQVLCAHELSRRYFDSNNSYSYMHCFDKTIIFFMWYDNVQLQHD